MLGSAGEHEVRPYVGGTYLGEHEVRPYVGGTYLGEHEVRPYAACCSFVRLFRVRFLVLIHRW